MNARTSGAVDKPLQATADRPDLFPSDQYQEAMAHLLYGVRGGGGLVLLTGDAGMGKTRVIHSFLQRLPKHCVVAVVGGAQRDTFALLQTVCSLFGLAPPAATGAKPFMDALNAFLLDTHAHGRQAMLIIDDAHRLSSGLLELLRLFTNLETPQRKLLQIVLVGRSELRDRLADPAMEQLAQRVTARHHMTGISAQRMSDYVLYRQQAAGWPTPPRLKLRAFRRLHQLSGGAPRQINRLLDRALKFSGHGAQASLSARAIGLAADEIFPVRVQRRRQWAQRGWAALFLTLLMAGLVLALKPWWPP